MAYTEEEKSEKFEMVIKDIVENSKSLRQAILGYEMPCINTFFKWLREDEEKMKQYAHACEAREEILFDEILDIADSSNADISFDEKMNVKIDGEAIARSRLKIDARKWVLSKMNPKKYGEKIDMTTDGKELPSAISVDYSKLSTETLKELEKATQKEE